MLGDQLLGNEVSEFVTNRQYAKIQYLQQENEQLSEQLKDMDKALRLNKDILKLAFETNSNVNNSNNSTNASSEQVYQKQLMQKLHEENEMLRNQLKKLQDERNVAQNRALLQEQISEEQYAFYKDLIQEMDDKLLELRRCVQDKEYTIQDIEKNRGTHENGNMVKIREIVTPNEQTLRLHEELESTRQILNKVSAESQNLQEQNQELKEINFNFKRELIKLRIVLRSPVAYYKMKEFIYDDYYGNTDDNLELQNEIYANPGFHQAEQVNQVDVMKQYGYNAQHTQHNSQSLKYLTNNERAIYQEKLQKSESLLKGFKELFDKEKNKSHLISAYLDEIMAKLQESYNSNQILVNSIQLRDQKIEQLQHDLVYYRSQYGNYMYFLKNKRQANLNMSVDKGSRQKPGKKKRDQPAIPEPIIQKQISQEKDEDEQVVQVSILEEQTPTKQTSNQGSPLKQRRLTIQTQELGDEFEEFCKPNTSPHKKSQNKNSQYQMNMTECKQFLLNSAKELYLQYNLRMNNLQRKQLMDWGDPLPIWHQKSSSDPLDYFTLNFQNIQISEHKNIGYDEEIARIRKKKAQKEKRETPFICDKSVIQSQPQQKPIQKMVIPNDDVSFISNDAEDVLNEM